MFIAWVSHLATRQQLVVKQRRRWFWMRFQVWVEYTRRSLAAGLHYVTLVRDPIKVRAALPLATTVRCLPPSSPLPALPL